MAQEGGGDSREGTGRFRRGGRPGWWSSGPWRDKRCRAGVRRGGLVVLRADRLPEEARVRLEPVFCQRADRPTSPARKLSISSREPYRCGCGTPLEPPRTATGGSAGTTYGITEAEGLHQRSTGRCLLGGQSQAAVWFSFRPAGNCFLDLPRLSRRAVRHARLTVLHGGDMNSRDG